MALEQHLATSFPNPTVGDVIGGRRILASNASVLSAALPNRVMIIGARYGTLPNTLQNKMTLAFGTGPLGEPINPVTFPWPKLNNHKVTLSFRPTTAADEQTLASLLPPGPITDVSQLPSSIPSYLIFVTPELAVDGVVVGQGNSMRLGQDLNFFFAITHLAPSANQTYTYALPAGSYVSVAVAGGSVSPTSRDRLKTKLTNTRIKLESGDAGLMNTLTREDILGDMFQVGTLVYFGQYLTLSHIASQPQEARHVLPSAYGTLGYEPNVQTLFGFPRAITPGGVAVNVRFQWVIGSPDGDVTKRPLLSLQTGLLSSALEHAVPEQMFSTPAQPAQGVSAVKALQVAATQGQRIYHITPQSQAQVLPSLHLDSLAISEITQALATGKEVITHTDRISVPGWTGEGYILFDPVTGDGAYKITGGSNGAFLIGVISAPALFVSLMTTVIAAFGVILGIAGFWALLIVAIIAVIVWTFVILELSVSPVASCFAAGNAVGNLLFGFLLTLSRTINNLLGISGLVQAAPHLATTCGSD